VAFIRLDFPPAQRDTAQEVAMRLAAIVGLEIKKLRPECTLREIAQWKYDSLSAAEIVMACGEEFGVECNGDTTFRAFVERVAVNRQKGT
jgi:acyl carrier protein